MPKIVTVVILLLVLLRAVLFLPHPFVDWIHDDVYFVSLAEAHRDPSLFASDRLFQSYRPAFPVPYIAALDVAFRVLGSPEAGIRIVPAALLAIYLLGLGALTFRLTGSRLAAIAVAILAAHPWPTPFVVSLGILPMRLFPRDVTTALLPWLLLLVDRGGRRLPFFLAGLLAAIHPVSAPHVFALALAWLLAAEWSGRTAEGAATGHSPGAPLRAMLIAAGLFLLGTVPYALALARVPNLSVPPTDLIRFRMPYVLPPALRDVARFLLLEIPPLALIGGAGIAAGRLAPGARRGLLALLVAAGAFAALEVLAPIAPVLLPLQPIRAAQYLYLPLLLGAGALFARLARARPPGRIVAALAFLFLANQARPAGEAARIAGRLGVRPDHPAVNFIESARPLDLLGTFARRAGFNERPQNFLLDTDPRTLARVVASSCVDQGGGRDAFLDLARFARESTAPDALFLVPPVGLDHFRVHARRGVFVTWKDGGVILFSKRYAELWYDRFREAVDLYADQDATGFGRLLASGAVQFVVCDARRPRLEFPVAYENARFVVYGPPAGPHPPPHSPSER